MLRSGHFVQGLVWLVLLVASPVLADVPVSAEVRDAGSRQMLYRIAQLGLISAGELQDLDRQYLAPDGELLASERIDLLAGPPGQPEVRYEAADGGPSWFLAHTGKRWRRGFHSAPDAREDKQWPSLGRGTVVASVLDLWLAGQREALLQGEPDSLSVYFPSDARVRRYAIEAESYASGRGDIIRIRLIRRSFFRADEMAVMLEVERESGRLLYYQGPARCLCAGDPMRQVVIDYQY